MQHHNKKRAINCVIIIDLIYNNPAVQVVMLDFGKKDRNPVDELCFYTKRDIDTAIKIKSTEVNNRINRTNN